MTRAQLREHYIGLTRYIVASMIPADSHEEIEVSAAWNSGQLKVNLSVPDEFRGMLIGRSGHMVRSIRQVLNAASLDVPGGVELDIV
jgi:predicted RNA-binding protein YlqC (UPF0109 family)